MTTCVGFDAIADKRARILILGSLPGAESLKQRRYYAKQSNSFWPIMSKLTGIARDAPYEKRLAQLRKHKIALWDVCASARRTGSLDSNIEPDTVITNDFISFFKQHAHIELICFNGQAAEKLFRRLVLKNLPSVLSAIERETLPSTSPAHAAMRFEEKAMRWHKILSPLLKD